MLALLRIALSGVGAGWTLWHWHALPQPLAAIAGFAVVGASVRLIRGRKGLALDLCGAAAVAASAVLLLGLNGGAGSPLVPVWLAAYAGVCLALRHHLRVQLAALGLTLASLALAAEAFPPLPFATALVAVAVGCSVVSKRHARTLTRAEEEAHHDALTGLPNRRGFDRRLARLLEAPRPPDLAVLWIDLDGFRHINNERGHAAGDLALVAAARAITDAVPDAFVARVGGDEFAALIDGAQRGRHEAGGIVHALAATEFDSAALGASVGIARVPDHGTSADELHAAADHALRWAKQRGKGIAVEFDRAHVDEGEQTVAGVRRLWETESIDIVVQPIVELRTGRVRSYEALARFRGSGPLAWFALAERHGIRVELELACLECALKLLPERPAGTRLSVNVSPELLLSAEGIGILDDVEDPSAVILELTENSLVEDYEQLRELLAPLQARGMLVAVDDFGAGRSNMRHVDALAPRYLKLDRSLVTNIAHDERKTAMVEALVRYTWRTDSLLVAEGVETTADLDALRRLGVFAAQGYRIAAPQPPWPVVEAHALATLTIDAVTPRELSALDVKNATITGAEAQQLFKNTANLSALVLVDASERVTGLLTRNRLLTSMSTQFGYALFSARPALNLADAKPLMLRGGAPRPELVGRAMSRDAETRYDPILIVDEYQRLVDGITIQELLEESNLPVPVRSLSEARERRTGVSAG